MRLSFGELLRVGQAAFWPRRFAEERKAQPHFLDFSDIAGSRYYEEIQIGNKNFEPKNCNPPDNML